MTILTQMRLSVADYHRRIADGSLGPADRVELIRGEVVPLMAIGPRHRRCTNNLTRIFGQKCGPDIEVASPGPVTLTDSEPEPDVALFPYRPEFAASHPGPADMLLVVEVADSSIDYDLGDKAALYAEHGIEEYWVVDLTTNTVVVHREPGVDGTWGKVTRHHRGETICVNAVPTVAVPINDVLP